MNGHVDGFPVSLDEDGVAVTRATAGPFEIEDLAFPPRHRIAPFDFDEAYLAVLLEGAMTKAFASRTHDLGAASVVTIPVDGRHGTDFSDVGCRVLIVRPGPGDDDQIDPFRRLTRDVRHVRDGAAASFAWRVASELQARDTAWSLAAHGLVLELVAAVARRSAPVAGRPPRWLEGALELLHAWPHEQPALGAIAAAGSGSSGRRSS